MKMVITGANSFLGRRLAEQAAAAGWETVLAARPGRAVELPPGARLLPLCMEDYARLGELAGGCDCLVHLAWKGTRGPQRLDARLQAENVRGARQAVQSMLRAGCRRVVIAGSQAAYGPHDGPVTEESACRPLTAYGRAKLACARQTARLCRDAGAEHKEARIFSLYGPGDDPGTMIMRTLRDMQAGRPCALTQGIQMWDYLHIDDAAEGMLRLCARPCPDGSYNLAGGDARPLREYVLEMARVVETRSLLRFGAVPYPAAGMVSLWPDISRIRRALRWQPEISFAEGIRSLLRAGPAGQPEGGQSR